MKQRRGKFRISSLVLAKLLQLPSGMRITGAESGEDGVIFSAVDGPLPLVEDGEESPLVAAKLIDKSDPVIPWKVVEWEFSPPVQQQSTAARQTTPEEEARAGLAALDREIGTNNLRSFACVFIGRDGHIAQAWCGQTADPALLGALLMLQGRVMEGIRKIPTKPWIEGIDTKGEE